MTEKFQLHLGNCLDVLKEFPDNSIDAIVTDPPYGLTQSKSKGSGGFMGQKWDADVPSVEIWAECLRVLKPGGNLLCFAGTRTQHRMVARVVESGFELQDMVGYCYGSGFPKSLNIAKAIDSHILRGGSNTRRLKQTNEEDREFIRDRAGNSKNNGIMGEDLPGRPPITASATEAAKKWDGWGTALKPAWEPISIFTKDGPLTLHADFKRLYYCAKASKKERNLGLDKIKNITFYIEEEIEEGTWGNQVQVAQLRVDTAQLPLKVIDASGTQSKSVQEWSMLLFGNPVMDQSHPTTTSTIKTETNLTTVSRILSYYQNWLIKENIPGVSLEMTDGGSLAGNVRDGTTSIIIIKGATVYPLGVDRAASKMRLKISVKDVSSGHPTIKPLKLMENLCELATPPGGTILDPFMGSGTTGIAALNLGFNFVGIEMGEEYFDIAQLRLNSLFPQSEE